MENNSTIQPNLSFAGIVHNVGDYSGARRIPAHSHDETELVYVMDGICESSFDGQNSAPMSATVGMAFLIPPHTLHDQTGRCSTVYFTMDLPIGEIPTVSLLLDLQADPYLGRWFRDLSKLWYKPIGKEADFLAGAIWQRILPTYQTAQAGTHLLPIPVRQGLYYIERNLHKNITVTDLARNTKTSPTQLNLLFRRYLGKSLMRYIYDLRLNTARRMLTGGILSIKEVAERCGFSSANYFARACTQKFGLSPRELRRELSTSKESRKKGAEFSR